jgi:hypothetical protein
MKRITHRALRGLFNPSLVLVSVLGKLPLRLFFELRLEIDALDRPYYGYGLLQAAREAKALGLDRISAIEFGVAGGNGLVAIERLGKEITRICGVGIDVYGFDLGSGLPQPSDYRDLPFIWQKSFFRMDEGAVARRLRSAKLVLGNVKETVPEFAKQDFSPIGFVSFDLDFYSSTSNALRIFDVDHSKLLPRVFCYFDDILCNDEEITSEYTGELLAIREFNESHEDRKIDLIPGLSHKRVIRAAWPDTVYVMHSFTHPKYNQYIYPEPQR